MFTKLFLERNNPSFKVISMPSPEKELEELEMNRYDCLISDYNMLGLNGLELARKIREKSNFYIVLYTGEGNEEVAEQAFSVGVDSYIRKEIHTSNYHVLSQNIKNVVEKHRASLLLVESERRFRNLARTLACSIAVVGLPATAFNTQRAKVSFSST
jgi:PleD family two-component response regulator